MSETPIRQRAPGAGRKRRASEVRQTKSLRLLPATLALLPATGQSEWVEQAIIAYAASQPLVRPGC